MTWLIRAFSSSLGKKYLMAVTGLLLCGFLVAHMSGNLLMLVGEDAYNAYAHALHSQEWLVRTMEIGLLAVFLLHLFLAFSLSQHNKAARGDREYALKKRKDGAVHNSPAGTDSWMLISGVIVLVFIVLHLTDFHFEQGDAVEKMITGKEVAYYESDGGVRNEPFRKAELLLEQKWRAAVYILGCLFLCAHLLHGVSSAFRSLGISHPKYTPIIQVCGYLFAVFFGLAFAMFPALALMGFFESTH